MSLMPLDICSETIACVATNTQDISVANDNSVSSKYDSRSKVQARDLRTSSGAACSTKASLMAAAATRAAGVRRLLKKETPSPTNDFRTGAAGVDAALAIGVKAMTWDATASMVLMMDGRDTEPSKSMCSFRLVVHE